MIGMMAGCAGKMLGRNADPQQSQLVIPDFPTAQEQFAFAKAYQGSQITSPELDKRRVQMDKVGQYYNRVLVNFPNDPQYVPLTYLELGDCAAQSDYFDKSIQAYQQAMSISQDEFIQVRAQYSIARIYDSMGRYVDAKAIYKRLIDEHKTTESGRVKDVLKRAYQRYMTVQEKPAQK
jgi:tetratricopeptide (TPR) repeat protein